MSAKNAMTIRQPGYKAESYPLHDGVAYSFFDRDGESSLAVNCWVDFVDIDDSELVGGSEVYAILWGLPLSEKQLADGCETLRFDDVPMERGEETTLCGCFFAGEFYPVSTMSFTALGDRRFQAELSVADLTEETDEPVTKVLIVGRLRNEPCEMEYPFED